MYLVNYEEVKHITAEEYFSGNNYSVDVFNNKYAITKQDGTKETPAEVFYRVASELSKYEKEATKYADKWFWLMWGGWFRPGGSILASVGLNRKSSTSNCTTLPLLDDTLEAIAQCEYETMKCAAYRQGIGVDFSKLRPRGSKVGNAALESTGVIPWMDKISRIGNYVGQAGRMPALLESLIVSHPDIEEFITCKDDLTKITNSNISVQALNTFMEKVENDEDWELRFEVKGNKEVISKIVKAKKLFRSIAEHAHKTAEPGVQFRNLLQDSIMYKAIADYLGDDRFMPHSSNACQPSFATVLSPKGIVTFGEINVGDVIWSGKNWTKVLNKWYTGNKEVFEYVTNIGNFIGTSNHNVFQNGEKLEVQSASALDANEGPVNRYTLIPSVIMDGLVMGDGSIHKASNNQVYLCIGEDDIDYFKSEIKELIIKDRSNSFRCGWEILTSIKAEELPKTYDREIPKRFFKGSQEVVRSFLRGIFSANGYVVDGRVCLKQTSYKLIKQIQIMLSSVGIRNYITRNKSKDVTFTNGTYSIKKSYDLNITKDRLIFANTIGFIQEYKTAKLHEYIDTLSTPCKPYKSTFDITDIISLGFYDVFDITVEDEEHTYWTGGVLVSNCSEKFMAPYSVCNLASINMENFSINPDEYIKELENIIPYIVRMADNVIEYELHKDLSPLPQQKWIIEQLREIGMGITNVHGWLLKQDLAYDSDESIIAVENFMKNYSRIVFKTSMELGAEKGNAPAFDLIEDKQLYMNTTYFRNIVNEFYAGDAFNVVAMRNMAHMSIAPAGSLSSIFPSPCISSGIEPVIGLYYWRRTRAIDKGNYTYYFIIPNRLKEYVLNKIEDKFSPDYVTLNIFSGSEQDEDGKIGKSLIGILNKYISPGFFKPAHEINPMKKIKLMSSVYKWMDASISCTYNLPSTATVDDVENIYMEAYRNDVRAVSIYREGSRQGILIFEDPLTNKAKYENKKTDKNRPEVIVPVYSPKRPKELVCNIHHCSIRGVPWLVLVGMLGETPYEVFAGEAEDLYLPKTCKNGKIIKCADSTYSLVVTIRKNEIEYKNLAYLLMDTEQRALTRLISLAIRHGCPLEFVQKQLKKANGDITNFSTVVARVLGSYIRPMDMIGEEAKCPSCGNYTMVREEGCAHCVSCHYSRCE